MADLKWIFEKRGGRGVYNDYQSVSMDTELVILPETMNCIIMYLTGKVFSFIYHVIFHDLIIRCYRTPSEVLCLVLLHGHQGTKELYVCHLVHHPWGSLMH